MNFSNFCRNVIFVSLEIDNSVFLSISTTDMSNSGKAGRHRHMGVKPTVRGVVMNPCDHPHGGGEGKSPVFCRHELR